MKTTEHQSRKAECRDDRFFELFGFKVKDFSSPYSFVKLLCRPCDPASLGILRFLYGLLMVIDIPQERGMANADSRWGNSNLCRFPLFSALTVLPLEWMYVVYFIMFTGAVGIMLGLMFRCSCIMFLIPYWYIFFLDKTVWNNHSYLYGLLAVLFLLSDANRYWSLDGLLSPSIRNAHIPLWNYTLFRSQIFLVYFIAGLKKLDTDWITGYSMQKLSKRWPFDPFRLVLSDDQIDLYIIHGGGLTIDFFTGFLLFFDKTRPTAMFFTATFHAMNSQLFSIGMFPYAMLATLPLFCSFSWPREVINKLSSYMKWLPWPSTDLDIQPSCHCIYQKAQIKSENRGESSVASVTPPPTQMNAVHKLGAIFTVLYICIQSFLPYSHGITKGYNNWTNGLYGYSWDMMVHTWNTQHIRLTYVNKKTGEVGYLDPQAWVDVASRWSSHGDMVVQYAHCIKSRLKQYDIHEVELYFDIWKSMNKRFQQRMFDPRVNVLEEKWSPFQEVSFSMPLLVDLSPWRSKLASMANNLSKTSNYTDVTFIADFPGLYLENFIQEDLDNTTITLLSGEIIVELVDQGGENITLKVGETIKVPSNQFHNVHTVSDTPSCYMYIFVNTTDVKFLENLNEVEEKLNITEASTVNISDIVKAIPDTDNPQLYLEAIEMRKREKQKVSKPILKRFKKFASKKFRLFYRSAQFALGAFKSIAFHEPFTEFLNKTYQMERESAAFYREQSP